MAPIGIIRHLHVELPAPDLRRRCVRRRHQRRPSIVIGFCYVVAVLPFKHFSTMAGGFAWV